MVGIWKPVFLLWLLFLASGEMAPLRMVDAKLCFEKSKRGSKGGCDKLDCSTGCLDQGYSGGLCRGIIFSKCYCYKPC